MSESKSRGDFRHQVARQLVKWLAGKSSLGRPRRLLRVWPIWERTARLLWPATLIRGSSHGLVSIHFGPYRREPVFLSDGSVVRAGDYVGEIHLNNRIFVESLRGAVGAEKWAAASMFRDELEALAAWIIQPDFPHELRAIFGVSILARGARRLGFTLHPRRVGIQSWLDRMFLEGLLILYTPEGQDRMALGRTFEEFPSEVWLSRDELLRRYGK